MEVTTTKIQIQLCMKYFFLLLVIISQKCVAQVGDSPKILIHDEYGYYCKSKKDNSVLLTRLNLDSNKVDSMYILSNSTGMFSEHPIVWELQDSTIFQLRLINDGGGMPYPELRAYKNSSLSKSVNKDQAYEYLLSRETLKDNEVSPLYSYIRKIYYKEDTLKGPLFFDIIQKTDSLFLYIYIHDKKLIETWNFNRYPLIVKKLDTSEVTRIIKKKVWELRGTVSIELTGPFHLIDINDKIYALDYSGSLWDLSGGNAKRKIAIIPSDKRGALLVYKDLKTVKYLKKLELEKHTKDIKNYLKKSSVEIKIK